MLFPLTSFQNSLEISLGVVACLSECQEIKESIMSATPSGRKVCASPRLSGASS